LTNLNFCAIINEQTCALDFFILRMKVFGSF